MAKENPASEIRLPDDSHRITIVGRTGSGKTVAGLWHLSKRDFLSVPWVIVDYKTDKNINAIKNAEHITLNQTPKRPGIYIVHPLPTQDEEVTEFLWKIWGRENIGLYFDEGYMIGSNPAFEALLTQGRSKNIPMIVLSQRPAWISRFVFSESDFFQEFHLNDKRDRKTIEAFMPVNTNNRLPTYHSRYYDVGRNSLVTFGPVPDAPETLAVINNRLKGKRNTI